MKVKKKLNLKLNYAEWNAASIRPGRDSQTSGMLYHLNKLVKFMYLCIFHNSDCKVTCTTD